MSDKYTPTTEHVRAHYTFDQGDTWKPERKEDFDRWLAEVRASAIEEAASRVEASARIDECGMHDVTGVHALPYLSQVMLNGVTRTRERLFKVAEEIRGEADL